MAKYLNISRVVELAGDTIQRVYYREKTGSTNDDALELVRQGAIVGSVVVADEQTRGRGRREAQWHATAGETLCFSLIAPKVEGGIPISLIAGVACVEALEESGVDLQIKWPNDVYARGKKLAGILVEVEGDKVVVGIGINVTAIPDEISAEATSLSVMGCQWSAEDVLGHVLKTLGERLLEESHTEDISVVQKLRSHCFLTGKAVELTTGDKRLEGYVTGIGDQGELIFCNNRTTLALISAEKIRVVNTV